MACALQLRGTLLSAVGPLTDTNAVSCGHGVFFFSLGLMMQDGR